MFWITKKVFLGSVAVAILYLAVLIYLININLVKTTLLGNYSIIYKTSLMVNLLGGLGGTMSTQGIFLIVLIALLTGLNLSLAIKQLGSLKNGYRVFAFSGGLLGILGGGCGACGLPLISLFGLSGILVLLPFRGMELEILAVILLLVSSVILIRSTDQKYCKIG